MLEETGVTAEQAAEAAWVVTPEGEKHRGAAAISVAFDELIGFGRIIYTVYRIPGIRQIEDRVYQFVGTNRMFFSRLFSTTPATKQSHWKPEQ